MFPDKEFHGKGFEKKILGAETTAVMLNIFYLKSGRKRIESTDCGTGQAEEAEFNHPGFQTACDFS